MQQTIQTIKSTRINISTRKPISAISCQFVTYLFIRWSTKSRSFSECKSRAGRAHKLLLHTDFFSRQQSPFLLFDSHHCEGVGSGRKWAGLQVPQSGSEVRGIVPTSLEATRVGPVVTSRSS